MTFRNYCVFVELFRTAPERIMIVGGMQSGRVHQKAFEERNITTKTVSTEEEVKFEFKKEMYDAVILNMELDDKDVAGIANI